MRCTYRNVKNTVAVKKSVQMKTVTLGLLSFMIVGVKENVPDIIKSVLERNIDGK